MAGLCKLDLAPSETGYSFTKRSEVLSVRLDGGASKFRTDQIGAAAIVNATWRINRRQYEYLNAFYRTAVRNGADPFEIDLIIDHADIKTYRAHFLPGSFGLNGIAGLQYTARAQLEVEPIKTDACYDEVIVALWPDGSLLLKELDSLVNDHIKTDLEA